MNRPIVFITTEKKASPNWWRVSSPVRTLCAKGYNAIVVKKYDVDLIPDNSIVVGQRMGSDNIDSIRMFVKKLHAKGCLVLVDFDDDCFTEAAIEHMNSIEGVTFIDYSEEQERLEQPIRRRMLQEVDGILVSTAELKMLVRRWTDKPCIIVPNSIDVDWFLGNMNKGLHRFDDAEIYVGWAGSGRPLRDLENMANGWAIVAERYENVSFVVGGWKPSVIFDNIDEDRIIYKSWTDLGDYVQMMQVDIGCTPLYPTEFNRCKSQIKALEYTVAGAAIVASPLYGGLVIHGHNGFIAYTAEEWAHYISRLVDGKIQRWAMRRSMLNIMNRGHIMSRNWKNWINAFLDVEEMVIK